MEALFFKYSEFEIWKVNTSRVRKENFLDSSYLHLRCCCCAFSDFSGVQFLEEAFVETKGLIGHVFSFHTATGILEKEKRSYYIACHLDGDVDINKLI